MNNDFVNDQDYINNHQYRNELLEIMNTMYYELMEKYSTYKRADLEKEKTLKEQWEES